MTIFSALLILGGIALLAACGAIWFVLNRRRAIREMQRRRAWMARERAEQGPTNLDRHLKSLGRHP